MNKLLLGVFCGLVVLFVAVLLEEPAAGKDPGVIVLRENNTVSLNTIILDQTIAPVQEALLEKAKSMPPTYPIYLVINSPGGSVSSGNNLIELAKGIKNPIETITLFGASMAFQTAQALGTRHVLESSVLMSHRASGGIEGDIPGSIQTRLNYFLSMLLEMDVRIAKRAGMPIEAYSAAIQNELWLTGKQSVDRHFADDLVKVRCDYSMTGLAKPVIYSLPLANVAVQWHKCPLITTPGSIAISDKEGKVSDHNRIQVMFTNGKRYIETYGAPNLLGE